MARLDTGEARTTYSGQQKKLDELSGQMGVLLDQYFTKLEEAGNRAPLSQSGGEGVGAGDLPPSSHSWTNVDRA